MLKIELFQAFVLDIWSRLFRQV